MSRRMAFGLLLLLAALLPVRVEASRTSVWERNPPASLTATRADAAALLDVLAPAARLDTSALADAEAAEPPLFSLGDIVLADTADVDAERFDLGPLTLVDPNLLRGPPQSYPETRVGGFELLPPFRVGASPTLSLWSRQACGFVCREVASDSRYDPWGLETGGAFTGNDPENQELHRRYMAGETPRTPQEKAFERATVGVGAGATLASLGGLGAAAAWPSVSAQWSIGSHWMGAKWFVLANAARGNFDRAVEFFSDLFSPDPRATGMAHPERGAWVPGGARRRPPLPADLRKYRRTTPTDEIREALNAPVVKVDAAYGTVLDKAEAGHLISADTIMRDSRFVPLNDEQRREILNLPENFVPLSRGSNASQGRRAPSEWPGHSKMGPLPADNRQELERLEAIAREAIERAFDRMLGDK